MKYIVALLAICTFNNPKNAEDVLKQMHDRYTGNWYSNFSFDQTTEQFRNDSLIKTSTWHEAIVFPGKFRIDFGEKEEKNAVIFLGDSAYNFRKGKLVNTRLNDDDLTFLLGGMYFVPFDSVTAKLRRQGYDLNKFREDKLGDKAVYVIGVADTISRSNQLWIDKEKLVVLKFIKFGGPNKEEGIFKDHQRFGTAWSETSCDFYINGKLVQREKYHDCKANIPIDSALFGVVHFIPRK